LYGPWPDDKGFLGKTKDATTGLTHIGAREYDPGIGQFISVDPILDSSDPQTINGYSYSANNPVTSSDPTGTIRMEQDGNQCSGGWKECGPGGSSLGGGNSSGGGTASGGDSSEEAPAVDPCSYWKCDSNGNLPVGDGTGAGNICNVSVSSGCDTEFRERVARDYAEMTVLDDYWNCTFHHDEQACDVAGSAFSSGGGTWAGSIFVAMSSRLQERLLNRAEASAANAANRAAIDRAIANSILGKRRAGLAGVLRVGQGDPQSLLSISGRQGTRKGVVPDVGAEGNPARYKATATGNNKREDDTEYKMLTYIANQLGKSSNVKGSLTLHSTQPACFSCTSVIGQFAQEFPNIRINYTSGQ
ncbi:RHS repeat-associated core domain-containing protein, partial [Streptomyces sp. NPDC050263]|uniref:RHS repeat-associated core domain-containing protein n=1 Tax=Streptomyces sp. NPDC050263 TaxID=3155037 RepID=UPI003415C853